MGFIERDTIERVEVLMNELEGKPADRKVAEVAREAAPDAERKGKGNECICCGAAIELADDSIVTGKNSPLMHAASGLILNAIKNIADIPDNMQLLSPNILESVGKMKHEILNKNSVSLDLEETLIVLSIAALSNPIAETVVEKLKGLKGCQVHITHIPTSGDETGLRRLGLNVTSDPVFSSKTLLTG